MKPLLLTLIVALCSCEQRESLDVKCAKHTTYVSYPWAVDPCVSYWLRKIAERCDGEK